MLQTDLKKYKNAFKESTATVNQNLDGLNTEDREFFVNLQNKATEAVKKGDVKTANEAREELMNFLNDKNAASHSGNK